MNRSYFFNYERRPPHNPIDPLSDLEVDKTEFTLFEPKIYGIGDFSLDSESFMALAVIFDLEGFTTFSSQNDPQLFVPQFINEFIDWVFNKISHLSVYENFENTLTLSAPLPFFAKFLGDGILLLWKVDDQNIKEYCQKHNTSIKDEISGDITNIISILYEITLSYRTELLKKLRKKYSRVPERLRCGVAQGLVYSLGNGADYIGPCINMASRLQKNEYSDLCILVRGIDFDQIPEDGLRSQDKDSKKLLVLKTIRVRGTGEELVCVIKSQYDQLSIQEKIKPTSEKIKNFEELNLSILSGNILKEISKSIDGTLLIIHHKNGVEYQTNNIKINSHNSIRENAKIDDAIKHLEELNLLKRNFNTKVIKYAITEYGYRIADSI